MQVLGYSWCHSSTVLSINEYTTAEKYDFNQYLNEDKNKNNLFKNLDAGWRVVLNLSL